MRQGALVQIQACPTKPYTPKTPTTSQIFGQAVRDDYRWLENDSQERDRWIQGQMGRTDCQLDSYPNHAGIKARLMEALTSQNTAFKGDLLQGEGFAVQWTRDEGAQYSKLSRFDGKDGQGEVIFDPATWPEGETLGWSTLSPDKNYLAFGRVLNGMDVGRMEILDVRSGQVVRTMDGANATTAPTWAADDDKLYLSAKEGPSGFVAYDVSDNNILHKADGWLAPYGDVAEYKGNVLYTTNAPTYLDEAAVFIDAQGRELETGIPVGRMTFSSQGTNVFIQTTADAPNGQVLMLDMSESQSGVPATRVLIPESEGRSITGVTALQDAVAVSYTDQAMPGLAVYDLDGRIIHQVPLDEPGALSGVEADDQGNLKFKWSTLAQPLVTKKLDMKTGQVTPVSERRVPNFNPQDFKVERQWYTSADGTKVPMTLAYKKGTELNGENPAHIYAYGGFNTSIEPSFSTTRLPFLEAGGVYAIAHVRGGVELGENWHDQATGLNRHKVYEDIAGAARFLADAGYTSADHLSIEGASNGGLVAGVAATRYPELFDAVISEVGLHDMARYEQLGGESWNQEYGSIHKREEALGLLSWSPYHNVQAGKAYPAMMVTTGKHDDRVDPAHSFKFAAKMQEIETPERPVFLRVEESLGHGHGATDAQWADRYADQWAFLLSELTDQDSAA
jgi:prolyl oligopeptidase